MQPDRRLDWQIFEEGLTAIRITLRIDRRTVKVIDDLVVVPDCVG